MPDGKAKRLWALPNAELTVPRSLLMHGAPNDLVTVPSPAYLIEHSKGLVLFDTGCSFDKCRRACNGAYPATAAQRGATHNP